MKELENDEEEHSFENSKASVGQQRATNLEFNMSAHKSSFSSEGFEPHPYWPDWNSFRDGVSINRKDWDGLIISEFFNCDPLVDDEYLTVLPSNKDYASVSHATNGQCKTSTVVDSLNSSDVMLNLDEDFAIVSPTLSPPESSADFPLDLVNLNVASNNQLDVPTDFDCENSQQDPTIDLNDSVLDALQLVAEEYSHSNTLDGMVDNFIPELAHSRVSGATVDDSFVSCHSDNTNLAHDVDFLTYDFSHENYLPYYNDVVKSSHADSISPAVSSSTTIASSSHAEFSYSVPGQLKYKRRKLPLRPIDFQVKCDSNDTKLRTDSYSNSNHNSEFATNNDYQQTFPTTTRNVFSSRFSKSDSTHSTGLPSRNAIQYSATINRSVANSNRSSKQSFWSNRVSGCNQVKRRPSILRTGRNVLLVSKDNCSHISNPPAYSLAHSHSQKSSGKISNIQKKVSRQMMVDHDKHIVDDYISTENIAEIVNQAGQSVVGTSYLSDNQFHRSNVSTLSENSLDSVDGSPYVISLDAVEDASNFSFGGGVMSRNNAPQMKERKEKVITQDMIDQRPRQAIRKYYSSFKKNMTRQDRKSTSNTSQTTSTKSNSVSNGNQTHSNHIKLDLPSSRNHSKRKSPPSVRSLSPHEVIPRVIQQEPEAIYPESIETVNLSRREYKVIVIDERDGRQEAVLVPNPPASITESVNDFYQDSVQPAPVNTNTALINQPSYHQFSHPLGVRATCIKGRSSRSLLKDIKVITMPDGTVQKAEPASIPPHFTIQNNQVYSFSCAKPDGASNDCSMLYAPSTSNFNQKIFSRAPCTFKAAVKRQAPVKLLAYSADGDTVDINLLSTKRF